MSLQVWLPLNGSLENRGLSNISFTTFGATTVVKEGGKIGEKCYYNDSNTNGGIYSLQRLNINNTLSMFAWINYSEKPCNPMGIGGMHTVFGNGYPHATGMGFQIITISGKNVLAVSTGDGTVRDWQVKYGTTELNPNVWYHVGFTYDGNLIKLYVNGILDTTYSYTTQKNIADFIYIFGWAQDGKNAARPNIFSEDYKFYGSINDFRIYDHCLSSREVKYLSQGLVAHYKLDNENPNLLNNSNGAGITQSGYQEYIFDSSTNGFGRFLNSGEKCTLTVCFTPAAHFSRFRPHLDNGSNPLTEDIYPNGAEQQIITITSRNGWSYMDGAPDTANGKGNLRLYIKNKSEVYDNSAAIVHWVKLQLGEYPEATIWSPSISESSNDYNAYDCSGYGNHLLQIGNVINTNISPRYLNAVNFNQSGYFKKDNFNLTAQQFTCAFWIKAPPNIATDQHFLFGTHNDWTGNGFSAWRDKNDTSYSIIVKSDKGTIDATHPNPWAGFSFSITPNTWEHIVYTYTGTELIGYKNGIEFRRDTYGNNGNVRLPVLYLGNSLFSNAAASEIDEASMSDFRIYMTALSGAAVKELYQSSISFLDNGTLQCWEIVEKDTNLKYNKNGIVQTTKIEETNTNLKLYNDKIQTFQIYEW